MMGRCGRPQDPQFAGYGGRGIFVCDAWARSFDEYAIWLIEASGGDLTLQVDREDNDGPYSPENCRMVTRLVNAQNKRNNVWLTAYGETKVLAEWARDERCVVSDRELARRVSNGWESIRALTDTPVPGPRRKTHCPKDHELTPENRYERGDGYLICKTCAKAAAKAQYYNQKNTTRSTT